MHRFTLTQTRIISCSAPRNLMLLAAALSAGILLPAQSAPSHPAHIASKTKAHRASKKPVPAPVAEQAPPPMPNWPVNDSPKPASVVWDASGLRINASNSSLQQILAEVSTDTGTKVVGNVPDQRVFGTYGPGQASDVLVQLLQGSGYNVLLAGDLGHGAPSQLVLTPRRAGGSTNTAAAPAPQQDMQQDSDDETVEQPEQPEEQPAPQPPQGPNQNQPNYGPSGPMRTPQEIMQEMQQRQLLQQQQMQQQMQQQQQQGNPTAPQQQENPE